MRFQFVDRLIRWEPGVAATGTKNVAASEPVFRDHFPRKAVLPGVLLLEGIQQVAAAMLEAGRLEAGAPARAGILSVDGLKFRDIVSPGDTVTYSVRTVSSDDAGAVVSASAEKGGATAATCRMAFGFSECPLQDVARRQKRLLAAWGFAAGPGGDANSASPTPEASAGT